MKKICMFIGILVVTWIFTGCYKHITKEAAAPADVKEVASGAAAPSGEEVDIIITAHVKKKPTENPYTFILLIDGKEIRESVKGIKEADSSVIEERGEGVHYLLVKRIRIKPGIHEIILKSGEEHGSKIEREFAGGKIYTLRFDPVYGPARYGRPKNFREGVMYFEIYLETEEHLIK